MNVLALPGVSSHFLPESELSPTRVKALWYLRADSQQHMDSSLGFSPPFWGDSQCFLPLWTQFYGTDQDQGRNGIAVGSYFDIASTLDTVCKHRFMAKSVIVGVIGYPGSSELHTFFHVLMSKIVGRPREVTNDQAPPHCSIPHLVELGAFSLSPTSSSTPKLDIHWSWQGMNR